MGGEPKYIVFFDGECNFCNSTVNFIYSKKDKSKIYFSSLQSNFSKNYFKKKNINIENISTIYFKDDNFIYSKSTAFLNILSHLKFPYNTLYIFSVFPKFLRDFFYELISKYRHKIIRKKISCKIPKDFDNSLFVDELSENSQS